MASAGPYASSPCFRQIIMPAPHHSVFYRLDALPATQQTASKHWRQCVLHIDRYTQTMEHQRLGWIFCYTERHVLKCDIKKIYPQLLRCHASKQSNMGCNKSRQWGQENHQPENHQQFIQMCIGIVVCSCSPASQKSHHHMAWCINLLARCSIAFTRINITLFMYCNASNVHIQSLPQLLSRSTFNFCPPAYCGSSDLLFLYRSLVHPDWILSMFIS